MADTFTTKLRLLAQQDQGNVNLWGNLFNEGVTELVEEAGTAEDVADVVVQLVLAVVADLLAEQA